MSTRRSRAAFGSETMAICEQGSYDSADGVHVDIAAACAHAISNTVTLLEDDFRRVVRRATDRERMDRPFETEIEIVEVRWCLFGLVANQILTHFAGNDTGRRRSFEWRIEKQDSIACCFKQQRR